MFSWLKDHFIPHRGNQHHPHILRTEALAFLLAVIVFTEGAFLISTLVLPKTSVFSLILPNILVDKANADRQSSSEQTLTVNLLLQQAAQLKANDMAAKGYFAHTSPAGVTPWYWLDHVGYRYTSAGENLAVNFFDSADVHTAWMNSPGHRANILNGTYSEIGIALARGKYQGSETTFVVEFFGKPKAPVVVPVAAVKPAATPRPTPKVLSARKISTRLPEVSTFVSAPRQTSNMIFYIIGGVLILSLALVAFVRRELPHPRVALKPMLLVVVILGMLIINQRVGGLAIINGSWYSGVTNSHN